MSYSTFRCSNHTYTSPLIAILCITEAVSSPTFYLSFLQLLYPLICFQIPRLPLRLSQSALKQWISHFRSGAPVSERWAGSSHCLFTHQDQLFLWDTDPYKSCFQVLFGSSKHLGHGRFICMCFLLVSLMLVQLCMAFSFIFLRSNGCCWLRLWILLSSSEECWFLCQGVILNCGCGDLHIHRMDPWKAPTVPQV